jgi:hypothetical protein
MLKKHPENSKTLIPNPAEVTSIEFFERKLRPRPFGQGHVCLGVTLSVALPRSSCFRTEAEGERRTGLRCRFRRRRRLKLSAHDLLCGTTSGGFPVSCCASRGQRAMGLEARISFSCLSFATPGQPHSETTSDFRVSRRKITVAGVRHGCRRRGLPTLAV